MLCSDTVELSGLLDLEDLDEKLFILPSASKLEVPISELTGTLWASDHQLTKAKAMDENVSQSHWSNYFKLMIAR